MTEVKDLTELRDQIQGEFGKLREKVSERDQEIKNLGQAKEETAEEIKRIDTRLQEMASEMQEKVASYEERIEQINEDLTKGNRPNYGGAAGAEAKSIGQLVVESETYQRLDASQKQGIPGGRSGRMVVESFHKNQPGPEIKALETGNPLTNALIEPLRVAGIISPMDEQLRVRDLIPFQSTDRPAVEWVEETIETVADDSAPFENLRETAAPVPEGDLKPEGHLSFELRNSTAKVVANTITASRQILSDSAMLRAFIDGRLRYSLKLEEDSQLLYGDGTGENLQGVLSHPNVGTYAWSDGAVGDSKIDALRRAQNEAFKAEMPATGIVMHPDDKTDIDVAKGDDGHYLWIESQFGPANRLIRLPLVETTRIVAGTAAVGAFALAVQGYDVWDAFVEIAEQHSDYRRRNLVLVVGEERLMLANYRPQAIIEVTFDAAPVAGP